jgi:hypothetical protein
MKQTMITYECDNCEDTAEPEVMEKTNPIPEGWVELTITNNHGYVAELLLCPRCEGVMKKALLRRNKNK